MNSPMPEADDSGPPLIGQRIVVLGNTSSGKSTMAAHLANLIGGKHVELDALYWLPNWTESETPAFQSRIREAIEGQPRWASSGNYITRAQDILWPEADTLVWLDLPLRTVLRRVVARTWRRWRDNELLWGTNRENVWRHLMLWDSDRSLVTFAIRYHRLKQREYAAQLADPRWSHLKRHHLRTPAEVARFLEQVEAQINAS